MSQLLTWLIEDHAPYRRALERLLVRAPELPLIRGFDRCETALAALRAGEPAPGVVLMDIGLPGMNGILGIQELKQVAPQVNVVVLTVFEDDDKIFRAICAGACGYLLKGQPADDVLVALRQAQQGGAPMNPRVARRVLEMFSRLSPAKTDYGLNEREVAVLQRMVEGLAAKQISGELGLNQHTTDYVIRCIYRKLHVRCLASAISVALNHGLVRARKTQTDQSIF